MGRLRDNGGAIAPGSVVRLKLNPAAFMQAAALALVLGMLAFDASSQAAYPSKPIRIVVPFPPRGID
jgi:hypothetical protein